MSLDLVYVNVYVDMCVNVWSVSLSLLGFNVDAEEDLSLVGGMQLKPYKRF